MEPCTNTTPRARVLFLFLVALSFLLVSFSSCTHPTYLSHYCPNTTLFVSDSIYHSNLTKLLSSLYYSPVPKTPANGNTGKSPNVIYFKYYCRTDTSDVCSDCIQTAASEIILRCPNRKVAIIWYDECTLRYSNKSFFSILSENPSYTMWNPHNISDPTRFSQLWSNMTNLTSTEAASYSDRFATREANFTQLQTLYSLAQCSPDLSGSDCNKCLASAIAYLPSCCRFSRGGRAFNPSCIIRFEIYAFYRLTASAPAHSPMINRITMPEKQGSSSRKIVSIAVLVAASGVILFSILFYCLLIRKKKENPSKDDGENAIITVESLQLISIQSLQQQITSQKSIR